MEADPRKLADELEQIKAALADPHAVHVNLLRGSIVRPSIDAIIHIYGEEALSTALRRAASEEAMGGVPKAFAEQACAIQTCGAEVTICCDTNEEARNVAEWLFGLPCQPPASPPPPKEIGELFAPSAINADGFDVALPPSPAVVASRLDWIASEAKRRGDTDLAATYRQIARMIRELGSQVASLTEREARLREALERLTEHYVQLVNCGDCGNWDPEEEDVVIAARAALAREEQQAGGEG